jgi:hypothetical protein
MPGKQSRVIVGLVESRCGYPIPGGRVTATSARGEVVEGTVDVQGRATFVISAGTWRFTPALAGTYHPETATLTITPGSICNAELALDFAPPNTMTVSSGGPCNPRQPKVTSCTRSRNEQPPN